MGRPIININGQEIILPEVKARVWREIIQFDEEHKNLKREEILLKLEKFCGVIALAFAVTTDEVMDNLNISDILPTYFAVLTTVASMLTEKLAKKNAEETVTSQT